MTYFLIFLAVIVAAGVALYVVGLNKPQTDGAALYDDGLAAPVANLPPVLLPSTPAASDVDSLRFSLGLRGYRMDQVDEILDKLRDELAAKDARIAALEAGLAPAPVDAPAKAIPATADSAAGSTGEQPTGTDPESGEQ
ncbi:DivIVA domain-containing protein [Arthrobacter sp. LAPM80]|uniref:DivIVA domain-containing protein n=1 Tax=Arthrobacter sp. LAPM80 TaxID=3141788 RepID=UPI00398AB19C